MELSDIVRVLRRGIWLLVVAAGVGALTGVATTTLSAPVFQASTRLFVSVQTGATTSASEINQGSSAAQAKVRTYIDVVPTARVLDPVIEELGLDESVGALAANVKASNQDGSSIVVISAKDSSPVRAADVANAVAKSFQAVVVDKLEQKLPNGTSPVAITELQIADPPKTSIEPKAQFTVMLGLAVGLALGAGILFLRAMIDTRILSADDVRAAVDAPLLGGIGSDPNAAKAPLVVRSSPRSPLAEAYRDLRTNIAYLDGDTAIRSLMVTSAMQAEGKTTVAANLAIAMSETGARVLVVDADLRRPRMAERFGLEGSAGLSDVLVGRAEPDDVIQAWGTAGLSVLPAGRIPPNPSELLGSRSMRALLAQLETAFDVVVIDAPPLLPVTDAAVLSKACDGAIVVAAVRRSRRAQLRVAIERLERIDSRLLGLVVTMIPSKRGGDFSYGSYGTYYASDDSVVDASLVMTRRAHMKPLRRR